jgi:hypothetical protein
MRAASPPVTSMPLMVSPTAVTVWRRPQKVPRRPRKTRRPVR